VRKRLAEWPLGRIIVAVALVSALPGCSQLRTRFGGGRAPTELPRGVELRSSEERPPVSLIARSGDPTSAVALALAHGSGSVASVALGTYLARRAESQGAPPMSVRPHGLGVLLEASVTDPEGARRFVTALRAALSTPLPDHAAEYEGVQRAVQALGARRFASVGEAALARCSGELGVSPEAALPDVRTAAGRAELERWRRAVYAAGNASFASLGATPVLEATAEAVANGEAWPLLGPATAEWPRGDESHVDPRGEDGHAGVALWVAEAPRALRAAEALGGAGSDLALRLGALGRDARIERAVATSRVGGACLRVDARLSPGLSAEQAARTTRVLLEEAEVALALGRSSAFALERSVLGVPDAREAAGVAAWNALTRAAAGAPVRSIVSVAGRFDAADFTRASSALKSARERRTLETTTRVEAGQGELWALLASPCGTSGETQSSAGQLAILLRALGSRTSEDGLVRFEPWLSADAVGLLVHGPRSHPGETSEAHARRLARELGRALLRPVDGATFSAVRGELVAELDPGAAAGRFTDNRSTLTYALNALAPERISWLDPRGAVSALEDATPLALEGTRLALLSGALRLAVLANSDAAQGDVVARELERWLGSFRSTPGRCANLAPVAPNPGRINVEPSRDAAAEEATIAVPLPPSPTGPGREARVVSLALNAQGGLLDRALAGLAASARARVLGGSRASALVIELRADPERLDAAVAQLRALLERLGSAGLPAAESARAVRELEQFERESAYDPRGRIVRLWQGERPSPELAVDRFVQSAFRPERMVVAVARRTSG
jgi:hypothetical protein